MPSAFFDLHLGGTTLEDQIGLESDGLEAARAAVRVLSDLAENALTDSHEKAVLVLARGNNGSLLTASLAVEVDEQS